MAYTLTELFKMMADALKMPKYSVEVKSNSATIKRVPVAKKTKSDPVEVEHSSSTAKKLLSSCGGIAHKMVRDHWTYKVRCPKGSFHYNSEHGKEANCAVYACFGLQDCGVLKPGQHFYSGTGGHIHCEDGVKERLQEKCHIITVGHAGRNADLRPGDVCCWDGHTNVYIGRNSSGHMLWYDAGYSGTVGHRPGTRFNNIGPRVRTSLETRKLYRVVRCK